MFPVTVFMAKSLLAACPTMLRWTMYSLAVWLVDSLLVLDGRGMPVAVSRSLELM